MAKIEIKTQDVQATSKACDYLDIPIDMENVKEFPQGYKVEVDIKKKGDLYELGWLAALYSMATENQ